MNETARGPGQSSILGLQVIAGPGDEAPRHRKAVAASSGSRRELVWGLGLIGFRELSQRGLERVWV